MYTFRVLSTGRVFTSIDKLINYLDNHPEATLVEVYNTNTKESVVLSTLSF